MGDQTDNSVDNLTTHDGSKRSCPRKERTASRVTFSALGRLATVPAEAPGPFADAS